MFLFLAVIILKIAHCVCPRVTSCVFNHDKTELTCSEGGLLTIPIELMHPTLRVLKISAPKEKRNNLTITAGLLTRSTALEEIQIIMSNITVIESNSFYDAKHLKVLDLSYNSISDVTQYYFVGLYGVVELRLDYNRIRKIDGGAFQRLPNLKTLSLVNNRIKELTPRLFRGLGKLRDFDLSDNAIEELNPQVFRDLQALTKFSCRCCSLKNINPIIYNFLSSLTCLNLADNNIKYISSDEFKDLKKLESLFLDGNQFPVILDGTFSGHNTPRIQTLSLSRNRLAKITTKAFLNLTTLVELNIGYNKLDKMELTTFSYLSDSLRVLDVSGNNIDISDLKYNLQIISQLEKLSVADMSLGKKDINIGLFENLEHLSFLNLSGNQFTKFPVKFVTPLQKLKVLDLSRNNIQGFDETALLKLESIKTLYVQSNPWTCDLCRVGAILSSVKQIPSLQNVTCAMPYSVRGTKLNSLSVTTLELCSTKDYEDSVAGLTLVTREAKLGIITLGVVAVVFVTLVAVVVLVVRQCRQHDVRYRSNSKSESVTTVQKFDKVGDAGVSTIEEVDLQVVNEA